jgi:hypothetical protein
MNDARFGPGEYQARPHYLLPIFLSALAVMLLAFGGTLTIALPWDIYGLTNGRERMPPSSSPSVKPKARISNGVIVFSISTSVPP